MDRWQHVECEQCVQAAPRSLASARQRWNANRHELGSTELRAQVTKSYKLHSNEKQITSAFKRNAYHRNPTGVRGDMRSFVTRPRGVTTVPVHEMCCARNKQAPKQTSIAIRNNAIVHCSLVKVLCGVLRALGKIRNLTNP